MEKITEAFFIKYLTKLHPDAKCALNYTNDYELFISIILSAQTTDKKVNEVTKTLFAKYPDINSLAVARKEDVIKIIKPIGLYNNKSVNIINAAKHLKEDNFSKIPSNFEELIKLPGVGRKTANVFLAEFYNQNTLGVDTHIMRVAKRLMIADDKDDALKTEIKLKAFLKSTNLKEAHHLIIAFGRGECDAKKPKCDNCELNKYCKINY